MQSPVHPLGENDLANHSAVNRSAMADATAIDWYIDYAAHQTDYKM